MRNTILFFLIIIIQGLCFSQETSTVTSFKIEGLKKMNPTFLQKFVAIQSGQELDSIIIQQDILRLKRLPGISNAKFQVNFYPENEGFEVVYTLEENFTIIPSANIWTSTNNQFSYRLGLYEFNFLGRAIAVGGYYQNNGHNTVSVNFRAPYLFSNKLGLAVNLKDWKSEEPYYFNQEEVRYLYNNKSAEIIGLYEVNLHHKLQLGASFFNEDFKHLSGVNPPNTPAGFSSDKIMFSAGYDYDRLNYSYQYVKGFRSVFTAQSISSKNPIQDDFVIGWNDFLFYKRVGVKGNWASRLRLGLSTNNNSPFAPFALDNNLNIRGVGNLIDRGTGVILLNTEYRHTLYEKKWFSLQGNTFIDSGTWRNPGGKLSDFVSSDNVKVYPGIGLRLIHNKIYNAIFRIDYGFGITKNGSSGIVFGIGQYF